MQSPWPLVGLHAVFLPKSGKVSTDTAVENLLARRSQRAVAGRRSAAAEPRPTGTVERFEDENDEVDGAAGMESQAPRMERFDDDDDDDEVAPQMDAASPTPAGDGLNDEE